MLSNDELSSRARGYIFGSVVMMALAFAMVTTRFACRIWLSKRKLWWDDLFIFLCLVLALANGACVNYAMGNLGWDRHIWQIPLNDLPESTWFYIISKLLFIATNTCVRMALLLFYFWLVRDFAGVAMKRVLLGCLIANGVICVVAMLFSIFGCLPVSAAWTFPRPAGAKCLEEWVVATAVGVFLTVADLILNVLPLPIVARLRISRRERIEIAVLLSVGAIATVAGACRAIWLYRAFGESGDPSWNSLPLWACSEVENYAGLVCACLPSIKPLWVKIFGHFKAKTEGLDRTESGSNPPIVNMLQISRTQTTDGRPSYQSSSKAWTKNESEVHSNILPSPTFSLLLPKCVETSETSFV